jgi:hypothetical protein
MTTGAGLIAAAGLPGLLAACARSPLGRPVLPRRTSQVRLSDLFLDDGGFLILYLDTIGPLPPTAWHDKGLPLGKLYTGALPGRLAWMKAYDFNMDEELVTEEMTQAWLIRAAELKSGRGFKPDALLTFPPAASLVSQA